MKLMLEIVLVRSYYNRGAHGERHNNEIIFSFKQKQLKVALDTN